MIFRKFKSKPVNKLKSTKKRKGYQPQSSKLETYFETTFLIPLKVEYKRQYRLSGKYYDFYIPSANLLIEVDGSYWHGESNENLNRMQLRNKRNDRKKDAIAARHNKPLLRIWESDIKNNTGKVFNMLQKQLGKT